MMARPKGISRQLGPEDNIGRCPHGATLAMLKTRCPSCHIVDLEAENARLQEQVKEADEVVVLAVAALHERVREVDLLKRERDDYKALAERRKGVLVKLLEEDVPMPPMIILDVHAAIDEVGI